ncbi:MAG TPA: glycosyltransferase [Candidatus Eremiobacteraeota bacterium]|nr:glycosyltransferase [Candidatus Eremiobacteraeota bacterium]
MEKISIIILSYNSLEETTKPCLQSIYKVKTLIPFEVIVVDNFSTDGTRDYLLSVCNKYNNFRYILNDKNYGFSGGNNIGIRAAEGDYYILLNSDTIVTDYWLDKIDRFFEVHSEVGMAGPVSNSVGNEQCIYVKGKTEEEIMKEGILWAEKYSDHFFYTSMIGFFCVAIRKEVIDSVGFLDESYGLGMFEDDDYCFRVIEKGYKLACLEDVFIYHKGSISFKKYDKLEELFHNNRKKFEDKFKIKWKSHYNTDSFIFVILHYMELMNDRNFLDIKEKIRNRLEIMKQFDYASKDLECRNFWKETLRQESLLNSLGEELARNREELARTKALNSFLNDSLEQLDNNIKVAGETKAWKIMCLLRRIKEELIKGNINEKKNFLIWIKKKLLRQNVTKDMALHRFSPVKPIQHKSPMSDYDSYVNKLNMILDHHQDRPVIILLSRVNWNISLFQRIQHMALKLASNGFLYFYCTPNDIDNIEDIKNISDSCYLIINCKYLMNIPRKKIVHIWSTDTKIEYDFIDYVINKGDIILYEYVDELSEDITGELPDFVMARHKKILENEKCIVIATADKLYEEVLKYRSKNCALITNGVDYEHFNQKFNIKDVPEEIKHIIKKRKPIIGYYGALAKWFDFELVIKIARERPDYEILIFGVNYDNSLHNHCLEYDNINILSSVNYWVLPRYTYWFQVAMIPFKINDITESTSPIKLFEYMAMGHPIVTTNMRECRKYKSVLIGIDHEDFINKLDKALLLKKDKIYQEVLTKEALDNTWESKAILMTGLIRKNM